MASSPRDVADRARAYLERRGDHSLGSAPQAFLEESAADAWACLWAACRRVDDALDESGVVPPRDWRGFLDSVPPARDELDAFGRIAPKAVAEVMADAKGAWEAVRRRHAWQRAPRLVDYVDASSRSAGLPMLAYFLLAGLELPAARDVGRLVGFSIQVGDDARDVDDDRAIGIVTTTEEETASDDPVWRSRVAAWALAQGAEALPRMSPHQAPAVVAPFLLWHRAVATSQLAPTGKPLVLAESGSSQDQLRRAYSPVMSEVAASPETVVGALRQDLVHRTKGLDAWTLSVLEASFLEVRVARR